MHNSTILHIRSKDCTQLTSGFNTDLQVNLNTAIGGPNSDLHLSLIDCQIPHTWFNISEQLENTKIRVDGVDSLVLSEASYDIYTILDAVNASTAFPYTATFDESTTKVTLANSDSSTHTINFSTSRGLAKALGFDRSDAIVAADASLTSGGVVNLAPVHAIYVHSDLSVGNVISTRQMNFESIIAKVPVATEQFEIINHAPDNPTVSVLDNKAVQSFRISLRDQNNKLLQLNDARFELSLMFQKHQREPARRLVVQPQQPASQPQPPLRSIPRPQPPPPTAQRSIPQPVPQPPPTAQRSIPQPPPPPPVQSTEEPEIDLLQAMLQAKILDLQ